MENKIQALLITDDYRGDHAADVKIAIEIDPDETVYQFVKRIFGIHKGDAKFYKYQDHIELRIVKPIEG